MPTNQELRQASVRAATGTAYAYNDDWMALFVAAGITSGTFNDRLLVWINTKLSSSYTNINDAMRMYAINQGFTSWNEMGTFSPGGTPPDTTAPILSSPTGTQTGATTATIGVTTNEANGTLYSFVSTSATPPSSTDLKAGTGAVFANSQTITTTGAKTASATGLTASTAYYAHWLHRDAAGNDSTIATSASFATASGSFAPTDLTGLMRWFDASDSFAGTTWSDKSGLAGHAVEQSGSSPTLIAAEKNGKSVLRWSATKFLVSPDFDMGLPTMFVVAKSTSSTGIRHFLRKWTGGLEMIMRLTSGAMTMNTFFANQAGTQASVTGPTATVDVWALYSARYDGTVIANSINGGTETTSALAGTGVAVTTQAMSIGGNGTGDTWAGDIAEVIIYDRQLTGPEKSSVESYLNTKWAL